MVIKLLIQYKNTQNLYSYELHIDDPRRHKIFVVKIFLYL